MNQKVKDDLFMAHGLGNEPYQKDSRVLIRTNAPYYKTATYRLLVNASGNKTPAGEYYEDEFNQILLTDGVKGQTFNDKQAVIKRGASEYIKLRNGTEVIVRTWNGSKYKYTQTGKRYFAKQKTEYVIEIPVNIIGHRSANEQGRARTRDSSYTRNAYMPVSHFGVAAIFANASLTSTQRVKRLKDAVMRKLPYVINERGQKVIHEESQEIWILDENGEWRYSELTVIQNEGAAASTEAVMHRKLKAIGLSHSFLIAPECILDEAWIGEEGCLQRQLAALLEIPIPEIEYDFSLLDMAWEEKGGASAALLLAYCSKFRLSCYIFWADRLIQRVVCPHAAMCVMCAIWDDHCYFYRKGSRATDICKSMIARMPQALPEWRLKSETPSKGELVTIPWPGIEAMKPDMDYHADELEDIRFKFLSSRRNPKVSLAGGPREIKKLTYVFSSLDGKKGECRIHRISKDADAIKKWYWRLPLDLNYEGENLPFASRKVLRALLRHPRGQLSRDQREALWTTQQEKCAICAELISIDVCEADHCVPLEEGGSNVDGNMQMLCRSCHQEKSNNEAFRASYDTLESRFAPSVYESYVKSPKVLPLVFQNNQPPHEGTLLMMDCIRCRRNALYECAVHLPVFSPLDSIELCSLTLGDLTYIDAPLPKTTGALMKALPFQGPGWYTLPATQWLLHTGKISWDRCTHKIDASARHPPDYLRNALEVMETSWSNTEGGHAYAKNSINSMIGTFDIRSESAWLLRSSRTEDDLKPLSNGQACLKIRTDYEGGSIYDYVLKTALVDNASFRPIHDLTLHTEATRMAQALAILEKLGTPQKCIYEFKTDSILFDPGRNSNKIKDALESTTFGDLPGLYNNLVKAKQKRLDTYSNIDGVESICKVFRCYEANEDDRLHCKRQLPVTDADRVDIKEEWQEVDPIQCIQQNESLLLLGRPGTGKSTLTCKLVKILEASGQHVVCAAKTHVAASRLPNGISLNHFVNSKVKRGRYPAWLVLDEISMIECSLWAMVSKLASCGTKFILVGDWNQYKAINDRWCGQPAERSAENSSLLWSMAGGNRCILTHNHRSDPKIFDFCASICPGGVRAALTLQEQVANAKMDFPLTKRKAAHSLVISHAKRRRINSEMNSLTRTRDAVYLKAPLTKQANAPQNAWIWPGMQLVCYMDGKRGNLYNGGWYEVVSVDHSKFRLKGEDEVEFEITAQDGMAKLRLTNALTFACVQGLTLQGVVRLHDCDHPRMDWRKLNVGISRATSSDLVEFA